MSLPPNTQPTGTPIYLDQFDSFVTTGQAVRADGGNQMTTKDQWILMPHLEGARSRRLLTANFENQVPVLTFTPKVTGHFAVYLGMQGSSDLEKYGIHIRVSTDPHFAFFVSGRREPTYREIFYKTAEFKPDTNIQIGSFGAGSALDYIKLVPVASPAANFGGGATGGGISGGGASGGRVIAINDFIVNLALNKPAGLEAAASVRKHKDAGFNLILWKVYKVACEYHTNIGARRDMGVAYDTYRQAVDEAKKIGIDLFAWFRVNNEDSKGGLFTSTPFHAAHPHMRMLRKDGLPRPRLSFAFPEVRKHKIDLICESVGYGADGLCIDILRHPPMAEYDLPLVEAFLKQTGEDPRKMPGDGSPQWLKFKATAFTQFLRETRAAIDQRFKGKNGKRLPIIMRTMDQPWRNIQCGCDVPSWVAENLVDGIIFGPHLPNPEFFPTRLECASYLPQMRSKVDAYAQVWSCGSFPQAELGAAQAYAAGMQGVALYESEVGIIRPELWENTWRLARPETLRFRPV